MNITIQFHLRQVICLCIGFISNCIDNALFGMHGCDMLGNANDSNLISSGNDNDTDEERMTLKIIFLSNCY